MKRAGTMAVALIALAGIALTGCEKESENPENGQEAVDPRVPTPERPFADIEGVYKAVRAEYIGLTHFMYDRYVQEHGERPPLPAVMLDEDGYVSIAKCQAITDEQAYNELGWEALLMGVEELSADLYDDIRLWAQSYRVRSARIIITADGTLYLGWLKDGAPEDHTLTPEQLVNTSSWYGARLTREGGVIKLTGDTGREAAYPPYVQDGHIVLDDLNAMKANGIYIKPHFRRMP